jgi:hypothetical protein
VAKELKKEEKDKHIGARLGKEFLQLFHVHRLP